MAGETPTSGGAAVTSERARWTLLAGASLVSVSLAAYEIVPASVTPLIRSSMGVDRSGAGLVVGAMFGEIGRASCRERVCLYV